MGGAVRVSGLFVGLRANLSACPVPTDSIIQINCSWAMSAKYLHSSLFSSLQNSIASNMLSFNLKTPLFKSNARY